MPRTTNATTEPAEPMIYHIWIKGHLGSRWEPWFEPMAITRLASGDTLLTGPIIDQAALHGVLAKVRDLGLPLVSVTTAEARPLNEPDVNEE